MILNLKINLNSDKTALTTRDELTTKEELDWRLAPEKTIWSEDEAEMTHNIVEAFEKCGIPFHGLVIDKDKIIHIFWSSEQHKIDMEEENESK